MHLIDRSRARLLLAAALAAGTMIGPDVSTVAITYAAQPPIVHVRPDAAARLDTYFAKLVQAHQFSGAVLLAQGSTILLSKGYGMADWNENMHNTADTEFIVPYAVPAHMAGEAILQLEDAGKLQDRDHICAYISRCPTAWSSITVHELLNFTTGITDYYSAPADSFPFGSSLSLDQVVGRLGSMPLSYKPGAASYSFTPSLPLEEYLVEHLSGESFATYLQQHVFKPLGLTHTGFYLHLPPALPALATGYQSWQVPASSKPGSIDASAWGGMVYSTVANLYHWEYAFLTGRVLSPAATAKLLTPTHTICPPGCIPGFAKEATTEALLVGSLRYRGVLVSPGGDERSDIGFGVTTEYYPTAKVTVVVLYNLISAQRYTTLLSALAPQIFS